MLLATTITKKKEKKNSVGVSNWSGNQEKFYDPQSNGSLPLTALCNARAEVISVPTLHTRKQPNKSNLLVVPIFFLAAVVFQFF